MQIRNLNAAEARKLPITEFDLETALGPDGLNISLEQFTDLCILCGCDYTNSIKGIGPVRALAMIREHGRSAAKGRAGGLGGGEV